MSHKIHVHFKIADPILYEYIQQIEMPLLELPSNLFERLCRSILGQQLSVKAAQTIFERMQLLFPDGVVAPDTLLAIPEEKIRACGVSGAKARSVRDLASRVSDGTLDLERLKELDEEQVIDELVKVRGIGRWTAEMFLLFSLGKEDIFSHGDLGLKRAIQIIYGFKNPPTMEQVEKIVKHWSPYRSFASRVLWRSLDNTPK